MTDRPVWRSVVSAFPSKHIVVAGDVMLDRYWYGSVARVSPEAPVVIVSKTRSVYVPGGAANAAANVAALSGQVSLIGVVGNDEAATQFAGALQLRGITEADLIPDQLRPTTVKTRIVAHQQHVVRIDEEFTGPIPQAIQIQVEAAVRQRLSSAHAMILSDYGKGVLTAGCLRALVRDAAAAGIPVFIDPKSRDVERYAGVTLLKPNRTELGMLTGGDVHDHQSTLAAGNLLLKQLPGTAILVTEGAEGMTLFRKNADPLTFRARAQAVFDVTGAGDTVIAAVALAYAAGADLADAVQIATVAAARVVEKVGTDVCTADELLAD